MASKIFSFVSIVATLTLAFLSPAEAQLSATFYDSVCPNALSTIQSGVQSAISTERRMGASLIRLFFHDCFINGCDAGILLEDTATFTGEQTALPNVNSVRGYNVIQSIKDSVDAACGTGIVSCADIVAVAARDSVAALGGPSYTIPVGRRDSTTAAPINTVNSELPGFSEDLQSIISKFGDKGFNATEMVALSGAHTVGMARCLTFRGRIYNENNIDTAFRDARQNECPNTTDGTGDGNLSALEGGSPNGFGNEYFTELINQRGLLHSDQVLFNNGSTDDVVRLYSNNANAFSVDFANAMIKMGNLGVLTGTDGQIRNNCGRVN